VADPSFCDIPIRFDADMPVGCMVVVSGDGRQVIPIVNLDIEVCGSLPPGPPKIEYGERRITGSMTANFEDKELFAHFVSGMKSFGQHAMEAIVNLGDQYARTGRLNRSGRKQWRKDRKRITGNIRRAEMRAWREACGEKPF
jgi:hypothetical protein